MATGEIAKGLHCHVNSYFVSILETIRDGLCRGIHSHINPFDSVRFDALGKSSGRESGDTKTRILQVRLSGFR
jgi:hypothetical protein